MTRPPDGVIAGMLLMYEHHAAYLERHWPRDLKLAGWMLLCSAPAWLNLWDEVHHPIGLWWVFYLGSGLVMVALAATLVNMAFVCRRAARGMRSAMAAFTREYAL